MLNPGQKVLGYNVNDFRGLTSSEKKNISSDFQQVDFYIQISVKVWYYGKS